MSYYYYIIYIFFISYILAIFLPYPKKLYTLTYIIKVLFSFSEKLFSSIFKKLKNHNSLILNILIYVFTIALSFFIPFLFIGGMRFLNIFLALIIECVLLYQLFSIRSIGDKAIKIYYELLNYDDDSAIKNVNDLLNNEINKSDIDYEIKYYDKEDIAKITIEVISKNICYNTTAIMLFSFIAGAPFALVYKSTELLLRPLISKNKIILIIYNIITFIPNYISSFIVILSSLILGLNYKNAFKIFMRDRNNNTIFGKVYNLSAISGALSISLGRNNIDYDDDDGEDNKILGEYEKNIIGDNIKDIRIGDIKTVINILYLSSLILFILGMVFRFVLYSILTW